MMRLDVNPGTEQARAWLQEELAKDEYHDGRSLIERVVRWIGEVLAKAQSATETGPGLAVHPIVIAVVAAAVVGVLVLALTKVRAGRRATQPRDQSLGALSLRPSQFRDRAAAAMREGRWSDAVLHYTRAIARDASDRTLLTDAPSLTAHEVGLRLAVVFPDHGPAAQRTTDLFDAVRYGRYAADASDAEHARATCEALRDARPQLTGTAPLAPSPAPEGDRTRP
ncbi:MAG: DUF4129 domain-containing protein [Dermatophilaceae bacterium]